MEIVNQHGYLRNAMFLEKMGGAASEYCLSEDEDKFIKVFYPKQYILFQQELEGINTIISAAGGRDKVPPFMLLPEAVISDGDNYCFVYETHPNAQDIQDYFSSGQKMDDKVFKQLLNTFLDCFNWMCQHRLAHRDYKMENCLIWSDERGTVTIKIIDFAFVSSYDEVNVSGTPGMWPIDLHLFHSNPSTGEPINLGSNKYKSSEVRQYFINCWAISPLRTLDKKEWKKIDVLIKMSNFSIDRSWTVKRLIRSIYSTLFPTEPGKYHDMYTLVMLFQQFFLLKGQIKMSAPVTCALQKMIGDKKYLLWSDLQKQFEEGLKGLMEVIQTS